VKTLIKGKKEKDNVLTNLELINLKNVTLLQFKEIRRKTTKAKKKVNGGQKEYQRNLQHLTTQLEMA